MSHTPTASSSETTHISVRPGQVMHNPTANGNQVKCVKEPCSDAVRNHIFKHLPAGAQKFKKQCKQMDDSYYYPQES